MTPLCYYLREFEAIFDKALTCVSGTQGKLFDEKKPDVEKGSFKSNEKQIFHLISQISFSSNSAHIHPIKRMVHSDFL
jgi:hypothetical protein